MVWLPGAVNSELQPGSCARRLNVCASPTGRSGSFGALVCRDGPTGAAAAGTELTNVQVPRTTRLVSRRVVDVRSVVRRSRSHTTLRSQDGRAGCSPER